MASPLGIAKAEHVEPARAESIAAAAKWRYDTWFIASETCELAKYAKYTQRGILAECRPVWPLFQLWYYR